MNKQGIKKTSWKVGSIILFNLLLLTIFSCARMGSPDGGWYDENTTKKYLEHRLQMVLTM